MHRPQYFPNSNPPRATPLHPLFSLRNSGGREESFTLKRRKPSLPPVMNLVHGHYDKAPMRERKDPCLSAFLEWSSEVLCGDVGGDGRIGFEESHS